MVIRKRNERKTTVHASSASIMLTSSLILAVSGSLLIWQLPGTGNTLDTTNTSIQSVNTPEVHRPVPSRTALTARPRPETGTHRLLRYEDCEEARLAGAAPIPQGAPGYRQGLDPDKDGIACESHETPGQTGESRRYQRRTPMATISSETAVAVIEQHDDETSRPECQLDLALRRVQAQGHVDEKQAPGSRFNASW
jgi:hypothetical protein